MADLTPWIIGGGLVVAGYYLYSTGALNSLFQPQTQYPTADPLAAFAPPAQPSQAPFDPNAYYDSYSQIPGIQSLIPTQTIVAQAPPEYLLPVPTCPFDSGLYSNPSIWASNKIWEAQYNQLAQTIAVRNQLALMRCGMVNWYNTIPYDVDFNNPLLQHISGSKRLIVDEFHNGNRDSGRANSAALDAAQAVHPITTSHGRTRASSTNGPTPGENSPPIRANSLGSTKPVNAYYGSFSYQAVAATPVPAAASGAAIVPASTTTAGTTVTPYGGGTTAVSGGLAPAPWLAAISGFTPGVGTTTVLVSGYATPKISMAYDEAHTTPCALGSCW